MLGLEAREKERYWVIMKRLLRLSWPIAVSMLSYSLMTAVDTLFVGRSGAVAIAAVGLGLTSYPVAVERGPRGADGRRAERGSPALPVPPLADRPSDRRSRRIQPPVG